MPTLALGVGEPKMNKEVSSLLQREHIVTGGDIEIETMN